MVKATFRLEHLAPLIVMGAGGLPSEGIKDNKVFTKFVEYGNISLSFGSEELPKTVGGLPFFREGVCFCPLSFTQRRAI